MSMIRSLGLVAIVSAAVGLAGCASETEFNSMDGRVGNLEAGLAGLGNRVDTLAAGDRAAVERAVKAAEEAKAAAEAARRSADAAAESSAKAEAMFRKSLRK